MSSDTYNRSLFPQHARGYDAPLLYMPLRRRLTLVPAFLAVALGASTAAAGPPPDPVRPAPKILLAAASQYLGARYRFGGESLRGIDCAGLVRRAFSIVGIDLPRTTTEQFEHGCAVAREELAAGDLVFFRDTYRRGISHVGIYIGESRFIHAARGGVAIASLDGPYWSRRFAGARRLISETPPPD